MGINRFNSQKPMRPNLMCIASLTKRNFAATTVNVPNMGDSISEGTLVEWQKS